MLRDFLQLAALLLRWILLLFLGLRLLGAPWSGRSGVVPLLVALLLLRKAA